MKNELSPAVVCALHLLDLFRAHPDHEAAPRARVLLERHAARGIRLRETDRLTQEARKLAEARCRLVELIGWRGGVVARRRAVFRRAQKMKTVLDSAHAAAAVP